MRFHVAKIVSTGSSRGSSVKVQVLLPAPQKATDFPVAFFVFIRRNWQVSLRLGHAPLRCALDSGSRERNFMEVQVLLPAPNDKALRTKSWTGHCQISPNFRLYSIGSSREETA